MFKNWRQTKQQQQQQQQKPILQRSLKGVLTEDGWKCNCDPRLPATQFTVGKENANQGRKFYTCSNRDTGCEFFLWDEDARARENNQSLSKPGGNSLKPTPPTPTTTPRRSTRNRPILQRIQESPIKRRISETDLDPSSWSPSGGDDSNDNSSLDELSNDWRQTVSHIHDFTTPRKEHGTSTRTSPGKNKNLRSTPPRPQTAHTPIRSVDGRFIPRIMAGNGEATDDIFTTPPTRPARSSIFDRPKTPPPRPPLHPTTPRSTKFLGSPGRGVRDDLISDVFVLLAKNNVNLKGSTRELRELLKRHLWQKEGISKGREVARQVLTRKTEECAELRARVEELEREREESKWAQDTMRRKMFELSVELEEFKLSQTQKSQQSPHLSV